MSKIVPMLIVGSCCQCVAILLLGVAVLFAATELTDNNRRTLELEQRIEVLERQE